MSFIGSSRTIEIIMWFFHSTKLRVYGSFWYWGSLIFVDWGSVCLNDSDKSTKSLHGGIKRTSDPIGSCMEGVMKNQQWLGQWQEHIPRQEMDMAQEQSFVGNLVFVFTKKNGIGEGGGMTKEHFLKEAFGVKRGRRLLLKQTTK